MAEKKTYWFVEPLAPETNTATADLLSRMGTPPDEAECKIPVEGWARLAYEVPYNIVRQLQNAEAYKGKFRVYTREGRHGKVRQWLFRGFPKPKKAVIRKSA